jgi:glycosyltransferase involved in cell wall biosynthesis
MLAESGAALVVPPEDPVALAGAFRQLADRPELRAELGARARAFAEEHFARDVALRRLETILSGFSRGSTGVSS